MTKKLKKFFATTLTMSMLLSTMNVVAFADSAETLDYSNVLEEIIKTSAKEIDDGIYEITTKIDPDDYDLKVSSSSNAECVCESRATDSNCTATDSDCDDCN
ncbi:MAG: hypothetical protein IKU20_05900, partial [Lachnospiraceae bacterium]|nr:hypothetical protein [Lachnospiraceae bacterium]